MQDLKRLSNRIKKELRSNGCDIAHGNVYELIAAYHGHDSWNAMLAGCPGQMTVTRRISELELDEHWDLIETTVFKYMESESEQTAD